MCSKLGQIMVVFHKFEEKTITISAMSFKFLVISWQIFLFFGKNLCAPIKNEVKLHFKNIHTYTPGGFVWCDRPFYLVKQPQEKWACDFHDDALPLSFQLQVAEAFF